MGRSTLPSRIARKMNAARKTKSGGTNGGRPRCPDRCPCGETTIKRAAARRHVCSAP